MLTFFRFHPEFPPHFLYFTLSQNRDSCRSSYVNTEFNGFYTCKRYNCLENCQALKTPHTYSITVLASVTVSLQYSNSNIIGKAVKLECFFSFDGFNKCDYQNMSDSCQILKFSELKSEAVKIHPSKNYKEN